MEKLDLGFISKLTRTTEEKNELIELLEELIENNFRKTQEPLPNTPFSKNATDTIYAEINRLGISNDREKIEGYYEKMLNEIKSLSEIRISIAIPPTEKLKNNLKTWAQENGLPNVIFNIEIKSEIIAGAVIMSTDGEYRNYSLSNQLDKYFIEKKQEILTLL